MFIKHLKTTNLQKHIKRAHPEQVKIKKNGDIVEIEEEETQTSDEGDSEQHISKKIKKQSTIRPYVARASYVRSDLRRKKITEQIALMIARDLQPFSFVEDEGFRSLLHTLDPNYIVPCSKTIKNILREDIFNNIIQSLKNTLDQGVATEFGIKEKLICLVTDNAANCKLACSLMHVPHLPCFAHTLNLVVGDALSGAAQFNDLLVKVRNIVSFFKRSNVAMNFLRDEQKKSSSAELKLLKDVNTRWNSILTMISRVIEIGDSLILALAKCANAPPSLTAEEYDILKEAIGILKIFEDATTQMSGEQYPTISLIIPIVLGIHNKLVEVEQDVHTDLAKFFIRLLKESIVKRLFPYEQRNTLQLASLLDPRVKKLGFKSPENANQAQDSLHSEVDKFDPRETGTQDQDQEDKIADWSGAEDNIANAQLRISEISRNFCVVLNKSVRVCSFKILCV
ncbi:hypothetical protein NQ315_012862 [Exocentrus adspersus]|uniref:Zinc finger BED domain-containing protein 1 n=1 Tax=Exocentrus adspersus TaxID=1586481 RepID=A0AAV8VG81_9CUCU|nr:hypothetical protein NQ315_012862 [Exocentrus adspersus]